MQVQISIINLNNRVKQKVQRDLFYNNNGILKKTTGGQLCPKYQFNKISNKYELIYEVKDLEVYVNIQKTNKKLVEEWFIKYLNYNNSDAQFNHSYSNNSFLVYDVPEEEIDDFTYDIDRHSFQYEII